MVPSSSAAAAAATALQGWLGARTVVDPNGCASAGAAVEEVMKARAARALAKEQKRKEKEKEKEKEKGGEEAKEG